MKIEPHIRVTGSEHWAALLLFLCLLFLVWVKTEYPRKIKALFREIFTGEIPVKEKGITLPSVLMFFIYLTCLSLIIINLAPFYFKLPIADRWESFMALFSILLIYYLARTALLLLIGFIFEELPATWDYISAIYIFTHLSGIILLPLAAIMIYTYGINHKLFGEIILGAGVLLVLYRTVRMFLIMTGRGLKTLYLILYICCLEIVPLSLFIKYGLLTHLQ